MCDRARPPNVVAITSPTASSEIGRTFARRSRSDEKNAAAYSSGGSTISSTRSGSSDDVRDARARSRARARRARTAIGYGTCSDWPRDHEGGRRPRGRRGRPARSCRSSICAGRRRASIGRILAPLGSGSAVRNGTGGGGDSERSSWFSEDELDEMSRPTMDRAIEALDRGDLRGREGAVRGDEARVAPAARPDGRRHGRADQLRAGSPRRRRRRGGLGVQPRARLAVARGGDRRSRTGAGWCTRSRRTGARTPCSGTGPEPGAFTITEDDEKFTFAMNPCGSGQRLWRNGAVRGAERLSASPTRRTTGATGATGFPLYCTHCSFMNEILPIRWIGLPGLPERPARRLRPRSVRLVLVQGPGRHPGASTGSATGWRGDEPHARRGRRRALRARARGLHQGSRRARPAPAPGRQGATRPMPSRRCASRRFPPGP